MSEQQQCLKSNFCLPWSAVKCPPNSLYLQIDFFADSWHKSLHPVWNVKFYVWL